MLNRERTKVERASFKEIFIDSEFLMYSHPKRRIDANSIRTATVKIGSA
jgi:hypothetical protein